MNLLFQLFLQFFNIGIFSFGGGYATLPFLYAIAENYGWYTTKELTDMLAVSSITPGPVGINVATYAGFTTSGIVGAFVATTSIILPSLVIATLVYKILNKFKTNKYVQGAVKALKPAGCALLSAVGVKLLFTSNLHISGFIILGIFLTSTFFKKFDPLIYFVAGAASGLLVGGFLL